MESSPDDDGITSNGDGGERTICDDVGDQKEGRGVNAQCARSIEKIVLQVLGGTRPNDMRLEHVIDVNTCLAVG